VENTYWHSPGLDLATEENKLATEENKLATEENKQVQCC